MYFDVTLELSEELPVYPGDPGIQIRQVQSMAKGASCNLSRLMFGSHSGTHIDAPGHFIPEGAGVDRIPISALIGPARVMEVAATRAVGRAQLSKVPLVPGERLLLKTRNSSFVSQSRFRKGYVYLSEGGARFLVEKGVRLVGIDYLSVERFGSKRYPAHKVLLENGVVILEGLDLSRVPPGRYELFCLPLKIKGCDGAPARVILRDSEGR